MLDKGLHQWHKCPDVEAEQLLVGGRILLARNVVAKDGESTLARGIWRIHFLWHVIPVGADTRVGNTVSFRRKVLRKEQVQKEQQVAATVIEGWCNRKCYSLALQHKIN